MARVLLVSYDVQTVTGRGYGVGAFVTHLALLLRGANEEVTIALINADYEPRRVDESFRAFYRRHGIRLMEVTIAATPKGRRPAFWGVRMSEAVEPLLGAFDVVYFGDWGNPAIQTLRRNRFRTGRRPVCVTVLHGASEWILFGDRQYPSVAIDAHLRYLERYCAQFSDFVVSPSEFMADRLRQSNWRFPNMSVLGLPMTAEDHPATEDREPERLDRIVYFGRLEKKKGFDLFVGAMKIAATREADLVRDREVVLLGSEDRHNPGAAAKVVGELNALGYRARQVADLDSRQANDFLRRGARSTLCVVPSRADNFPYALIEASLIPGLNLISCRVGGIAEMFGESFAHQLSEASAPSIADLIVGTLRRPLAPSELFRYAVEPANRRWMEFHEMVVRHGGERQFSPPRDQPAVDLCVMRAELSENLQQSLDRQTTRNFVIVSSPAEGRGAFLLLADGNVSLTDDAIERLSQAIQLSAADCLACGGWEGSNKEFTHMPLGPDLAGALFDPDVLGQSVLMVRRSALEAVFSDWPTGANHSAWEIQAKLALKGFSVDVFPEYLYWRPEADGVRPGEEMRLLVEAYDTATSGIGLPGLASALAGVRSAQGDLVAKLELLERQIRLRRRRMAYLDGPWLDGTDHDDPSPWPLRTARRLYRSWVPLETRLSIQQRFVDRVRNLAARNKDRKS